MTDTDFTRALHHDPHRDRLLARYYDRYRAIPDEAARVWPYEPTQANHLAWASTYDEHPMSHAEWLARRDAGAL